MNDYSAQIFDKLGADYDDVFTRSNIGKAQRNRVWEHLQRSIKRNNIRRVLELNCGTGIDARWLASKGCEVLATDISPEMLNVAKRNEKAELAIRYKQADLRDLKPLSKEGHFDLIFSNFGGMNCVSKPDLAKALSTCAELLNPEGVMMTVIMPRFCLWESAYYIYKRDLKKAVRRWSKKGSSFTQGEHTMNIYYYSPYELAKLASPQFYTTHVKPIGALIPPSYCEDTFLGNSRIVNRLAWLESYLPPSSKAAAVADHYLMEFHKK